MDSSLPQRKGLPNTLGGLKAPAVQSGAARVRVHWTGILGRETGGTLLAPRGFRLSGLGFGVTMNRRNPSVEFCNLTSLASRRMRRTDFGRSMMSSAC